MDILTYLHISTRCNSCTNLHVPL